MKRIGTAVALSLLTVVSLGIEPANAASSTSNGAAAHYKGKTFDMSKGWGKAQVCSVTGKSEVQCFDSSTETTSYLQKNALLGAPATNTVSEVKNANSTNAVSAAASTPSCDKGYFCLYEHINGGGRRLQFRDNYWQDLNAYGFGRQTSAVRNNKASGDVAAIGQYGAGYEAKYTSGTYVSWLGSYNDWADKVRG